jgi:hypothetical protein
MEQTMGYNCTFKDCLERSERVTWRIEDVIGGEKRLDFTRPFMPESLARVQGLNFLSEHEKMLLNQIRGHTYLRIFGLVEEFILPFVLDHTRTNLEGEDYRTRAFLEFAGEEAKHIQLFRRFAEEFNNGFGTPCDIIGPPEAVAKHVLGHHPLSVALVILHIEWMTQRHFIDSVKDDGRLDPCFKSMLKNHWMEEMQHAQLDAMMVQSLSETMTRAELEAAIDGYWAIGGFLDGGLKQQMLFDLAAFETAAKRTLTAAERQQFMDVQQQANRWTYLGSGMSHPKFIEAMGALSMDRQRDLMQAIPQFS